jgi:Fic family protein
MPSAQLVARDLDDLAAIIAANPEGLTGLEIAAAYARAHPGRSKLPKHTMVRRLAELERQKRLTTAGNYRWRRYLPTTETPNADVPVDMTVEAAQPTATEISGADDIPLSPEGEAVRMLIRRPLAEKPAIIRYDENLLLGYKPGTTFYLPEALRKDLHERGRTPASDRPAGTYARHIYERLLIDLAWASSRLEGNQYTRIDTKNLLEKNIRAHGKSPKDAQMILNHRKAIELLVTQAEEIGYNRYTFCNLHAALSENLLANPEDEGRLRRYPVGIDGSPYEPPDVPQQIEEFFDHMLATVSLISDPFEQAFFLMVHLPYLQPFADVNKRTSRLAANLPLIKANLTPLSFVRTAEQAYVEGTLGVYEERRIEMLRDVFAEVYRRSCERYQAVRRDTAEPDPMRLRYTPQLHALVSEIVGKPARPDRGVIVEWAAAHDVAAADTEQFAEIGLTLLDSLHEGSISRYGIRQGQFHTWRDLIDAPADAT